MSAVFPSSAWPPPPTHILFVDRGLKARHVRNVGPVLAALEMALRGAKAAEVVLAEERARREAAEQALAAVAQLPSVVAAARGSPMRSPPISPMRSPGGESTYSM